MKLFTHALFALCLLALLAACTPVVSPTTPPTFTPLAPSATVTLPAASATAEPPTGTPLPTSTFTVTPSPTATAAPLFYTPDNLPANINPLTGLPVSDLALLQRRPVAFKINLYPREYYRPPFGLQGADIVFDYYHNDGYTRLHAIFYGSPAAQVGSIRSGRMLDAQLMRMYKSFLAFGNADEQILSVLAAPDLYARLLYATDAPCPASTEHPLCREDPKGYNHLLGDTEAIHAYMQNKGVEDGPQDLKGLTFGELVPPGGLPLPGISVRFSADDYHRWEYDADSGKYLRFQDASYALDTPETFAPFMDRVANQQISAANVVVVFAPHETLRAEPYGVVDVRLQGSGKAYLLRDGKVYEVTWVLPTPTSVLSFTDAEGNPFPLKPGNTWIDVLSIESETKEQEDGSWRFLFHLFSTGPTPTPSVTP